MKARIRQDSHSTFALWDISGQSEICNACKDLEGVVGGIFSLCHWEKFDLDRGKPDGSRQRRRRRSCLIPPTFTNCFWVLQYLSSVLHGNTMDTGFG